LASKKAKDSRKEHTLFAGVHFSHADSDNIVPTVSTAKAPALHSSLTTESLSSRFPGRQLVWPFCPVAIVLKWNR
jgi:hypothetical protein